MYAFPTRRAGPVTAAVTMRNIPFARPLLAAVGIAAALATGACSENRHFERESAGAQTKLAGPASMTPPIGVRGIDGAPDGWKLAERVAEALRSRDIPASAASRSRSAYVLKGEMRPGAERNGRSRVEVVWSLYDGLGKKVGEVTQMAAVPGAAFRTPNEGVVEALADAAAESIAPLVPSSSHQLADGTETGERRGNDRAKMEERDRVAAVGKMKSTTGVSKNLLAPPKPAVKPQAKIDAGTPGKTVATPPPASRHSATPPSATPPSAAPPATTADKKALSAVGRYEGAGTLSRNLFRPEGDPAKPLPPPQRVKETARPPADAEESLSAVPEPASDTGRRTAEATPPMRPPMRIAPPQRAEAESPKTDVAAPPERPRQLAESPAPRREARSEPRPVQYAEKPGHAGYEYWIQIGSNTDEAASRAQWEKMQSAAQSLFANVGNRIQRADLGKRGVYYRVQVGPFASPGAAGQFCARLKARQIDCFLAQPEVATASTKPPEAAPAPKKAALPAPKPIAKPAETKPDAPKPLAKPAEPKVAPKPVAKQAAEPKPGAAPAEKPKEAAAAPKKPDADTPPLPDSRPSKNSSAEKPDAPISTAPGLPGVLD